MLIIIIFFNYLNLRIYKIFYIIMTINKPYLYKNIIINQKYYIMNKIINYFVAKRHKIRYNIIKILEKEKKI